MSCIETSEAPEWLSKLESRREKLSKAKLGHDSGLGARCNACGPKCPGLELHFWRKICRACRCSKDTHDVDDDDLPGWAHFELLGAAKPKRSGAAVMKIRGVDEPVKLDWVPLDATPEMISDYMTSLGEGLAPVTGSEGAARRREQLRRQIPLHDIRSDLCCHALTPQEQNNHREYISRIKDHIVGMGNVVRVGALKKGEVSYVNVEENRPVTGAIKSYGLPLKASALDKRIRYATVPKGSTDKSLVLDKMGNAIAKSAHVADFRPSPILSAIVKNKLTAMNIESDRIKSAVEHGPVYDRLFEDLEKLSVPAESDVYLAPIKAFRKEFRANPKFRDETTAFVESQGGGAMSSIVRGFNNNGDAAPQKGTIYGPNGEIWSWSLQSPNSNSTREYPEDDDDVPPSPNFSTHPNCASIAPDERFANLSVSSQAHKNGEAIPCQRCREGIASGEIAVTAERAGDAYWHPRCFACVKCDQLLVDNVYFYHKGEVYCQRDLAEALKVTRCAACDELIFSQSYTMAEGRCFHADHFCCLQCDGPLADKRYVHDDKTGQPLCLPCYERFYAERCHGCKAPIEPQEQGVSWQAFHWHGSCFNCANAECAKSLLRGKFVVKNEMPFCSAQCVRKTIA